MKKGIFTQLLLSILFLCTPLFIAAQCDGNFNLTTQLSVDTFQQRLVVPALEADQTFELKVDLTVLNPETISSLFLKTENGHSMDASIPFEFMNTRFFATSSHPPIQKKQPSLEIHPNPVNDILSIQFKDSKNFRYSIFDAFGRLVTSSDQSAINISGWAAGLYVLKYADRDGQIADAITFLVL